MRPPRLFAFFFPFRRRRARRHGPMRRAYSCRVGGFEWLPARTLLTVATMFDETTGALTITGDDLGDDILISPSFLSNSSISASSVRSISVTSGSGDDTIDLSCVGSAYFPALTSVTVHAGAGDDSVFGSQLGSRLYGEAGDDYLQGYDGDDWFDGGPGSDCLSAGTGNDTFAFSGSGDLGDDILDGAGDQSLDFSNLDFGVGVTVSAMDARHGLAIAVDGGNRLSFNGSTSPNITGIIGTKYADTLTAAPGGWLRGGSGNDSLITGSCTTYIFDPVDGDLGSDTITLSANSGDTLDFSAFTSGITIDIGSTSMQPIVSGEFSLRLTSTSGIDNVVGGSGNDIIWGNGRNNMIAGRAGDDFISGGAGNDVLIGDEGNDTYDGGAGSNTYVFCGSENLGTDTIVTQP